MVVFFCGPRQRNRRDVPALPVNNTGNADEGADRVGSPDKKADRFRPVRAGTKKLNSDRNNSPVATNRRSNRTDGAAARSGIFGEYSTEWKRATIAAKIDGNENNKHTTDGDEEENTAEAARVEFDNEFFKLAAIAGVDPTGLTYHQLTIMALEKTKERWLHTSHLMWISAAAFADHKKPAPKPDDFNPYRLPPPVNRDSATESARRDGDRQQRTAPAPRYPRMTKDTVAAVKRMVR